MDIPQGNIRWRSDHVCHIFALVKAVVAGAKLPDAARAERLVAYEPE
jgi:hypothetical protein